VASLFIGGILSLVLRPPPRRLDSFLAECRLGTRARVRAALAEGAVEVDGVEVVQERTLVDETCVIRIRGVLAVPSPRRILAVYHKPAGLLTTMSDPHGRACVGDVVPQAWHGVCGPVGRLDKATTGTLIFTDDGALHAAITGNLPKTYRLTVKGTVTDDHLARLSAGVSIVRARVSMALRGTFVTAPAVAARCEGGLTLTIWEGRNRQVRRMAKAVGLRLVHLHRDAVGEVLCPGEEGAVRDLTDVEEASLRAAQPLGTERFAQVAAQLQHRRSRELFDPRELRLVNAWLDLWAGRSAPPDAGD
jgi:23S rRNA pseudouridine2605 synthase